MGPFKCYVTQWGWVGLRFRRKKTLAPRASGKSIVVARTGPTASKRHAAQRAHSQCQGPDTMIVSDILKVMHCLSVTYLK